MVAEEAAMEAVVVVEDAGAGAVEAEEEDGKTNRRGQLFCAFVSDHSSNNNCIANFQNCIHNTVIVLKCS